MDVISPLGENRNPASTPRTDQKHCRQRAEPRSRARRSAAFRGRRGQCRVHPADEVHGQNASNQDHIFQEADSPNHR